MKYTRILLQILMIGCLATGFLASCGDDEPDTPAARAKRTVLIYMCAENSLSSLQYYDSLEIVKGAANLPENVNLIMFADRTSKSVKPYIAKVDKNGTHIVKSYKEDFYCTDKEKMAEVINWTFTKYPADSYAMTFWGHSNGWIPMPDKNIAKANAKRKAYGWDSGVDNPDGGDGINKFINIPELAEVLSQTQHLDYIFFDCCQMMCAEVTYELRNVCDYVIGSPAEIPGHGAPYDYVVQDFFLSKENVGKAIADDYIKNTNFSLNGADGLPLSVVKTSNMENLLAVTKNAIDTVMAHYPYPNNLPVYDVIYYGKNDAAANNPIFYDLRNVMRKYLSKEDFDTWDNVFQQTVVYSVHPRDVSETRIEEWISQELHLSNFRKFQMNDENYGGLSMFIPQTYYSYVDSKNFLNPNICIKTMQWNNGIDWTKFGWE